MKNNKPQKDIFNLEIGNKKIPPEELMLLCTQYQTVLKAGLQVSRATSLLLSQVESKKLKSILKNVQRDVDSGKALSNSFEKYGKGALPQTFFETIRAGEHSGDLAKSFGTLKDYYKKQSKLSKQIKSALIYPVFVLAISVIVLIVIMAYVMPQLVSIFENMSGELPTITKILISISNFFSKNIVIIIASIVALIVGIIALGRSKKGRLFIDEIKLKIPIIGSINLCNNSATFASTLSMLLSSGIVLSKALMILSRVFTNQIYSESVLRISKSVETGKSIYLSIKKEKYMPHVLCEMVGIGEETGELEEILETTGEYYQEEAENKTKNMISKLEPAMLVFVAALAGFIVFAIYIPLFQMYDLF